MKKGKLSLKSIKVKSFITNIDEARSKIIKAGGGHGTTVIDRGRFLFYNKPLHLLI